MVNKFTTTQYRSLTDKEVTKRYCLSTVGVLRGGLLLCDSVRNCNPFSPRLVFAGIRYKSITNQHYQPVTERLILWRNNFMSKKRWKRNSLNKHTKDDRTYKLERKRYYFLHYTYKSLSFSLSDIVCMCVCLLLCLSQICYYYDFHISFYERNILNLSIRNLIRGLRQRVCVFFQFLVEWVYIYMRVCLYTHIYIYRCMSVCMSIICVCLYICVDIHTVYMYTYTHIYTIYM